MWRPSVCGQGRLVCVKLPECWSPLPCPAKLCNCKRGTLLWSALCVTPLPPPPPPPPLGCQGRGAGQQACDHGRLLQPGARPAQDTHGPDQHTGQRLPQASRHVCQQAAPGSADGRHCGCSTSVCGGRAGGTQHGTTGVFGGCVCHSHTTLGDENVSLVRAAQLACVRINTW